MEEATYKINHDPIGKCICGHTASAHGSKGMICCACECRQFREGLGLSDWTVVVKTGLPYTIMPKGSYELDSNEVIILQDGEKKR